MMLLLTGHGHGAWASSITNAACREIQVFSTASERGICMYLFWYFLVFMDNVSMANSVFRLWHLCKLQKINDLLVLGTILSLIYWYWLKGKKYIFKKHWKSKILMRTMSIERSQDNAIWISFFIYCLWYKFLCNTGLVRVQVML